MRIVVQVTLISFLKSFHLDVYLSPFENLKLFAITERKDSIFINPYYCRG